MVSLIGIIGVALIGMTFIFGMLNNVPLIGGAFSFFVDNKLLLYLAGFPMVAWDISRNLLITIVLTVIFGIILNLGLLPI
jgi:hypothetical protein